MMFSSPEFMILMLVQICKCIINGTQMATQSWDYLFLTFVDSLLKMNIYSSQKLMSVIITRTTAQLPYNI